MAWGVYSSSSSLIRHKEGVMDLEFLYVDYVGSCLGAIVPVEAYLVPKLGNKTPWWILQHET